MAKDKVEISEDTPNDQEAALIAAVPREAFKAMFYLFVGKPDSSVRLFRRRVTVDPNSFYDLNEKIVSKLRLHDVQGIATTVAVKFEKGNIVEFGTWAEFESDDWKTSLVTEELSIRWDFLVKLAAYQAPQRHTLTVRLSSMPRPKDIFQALMSHDPDSDVDIDTKLAICVAKVDFISHRLATELLEIVREWDQSLPQPETASGWFAALSKHDDWIARAIHYSLPLLVGGLCLAVLRATLPKELSGPVTNQSFIIGLQWLMISGLGVFVASRTSRHLAGRCHRALNEYNTVSPFLLTRGDESKMQTSGKRNGRKKLDFLVSAGIAFALDVAAGVTAGVLIR